MNDNLRSKTLYALLWSFFESVGLQAVRFVIGIILARLLLPEQFGLIAMLMIFMAVAQSFLDSGFGAALIQKKDSTQLDTCSIFYFNILVGIVATGLLCLLAPLIAAFYMQPILTPLTQALSLTILINSFGLIQGVILTKQINFKTQTKVSLIAALLSGTIGIIMAITGYGVWSLVVQQIASSLLRTIFLWFLSPWRPELIFSIKSLREMFGFGSRLLASGLLNQIFDNIYYIVIGKLFSPAALGFFSRAHTIQALPSHTLGQMVARVTFPVFSTIQDDPERLRKGFQKALTTLILVQFPIMIGLAIVSRPLVLILLTDTWTGCINYLQLLCLAGLLFPVHLINLNLLQALGKSNLFLRLEIIKKLLIIISIAITWRWGITTMIYGMIAVSIICYYINSYYTGALIGYSILAQSRDMLPYFIISTIMGVAAYAIGFLPFPGNWSLLIAQITLGALIYISSCRLFRLPAFMELWQMILNRSPFRNTGITSK
jgi:O-antigen/teichoic acid export membrane protein